MALYYVELSRMVQFKGWLEIEAEDENTADATAQRKIEEGDIYLKQVSDYTETGPIFDIELEEKIEEHLRHE
jgi:hypothetical protein